MSSHRRNFVCEGRDISKVVVTVTITFKVQFKFSFKRRGLTFYSNAHL